MHTFTDEQISGKELNHLGLVAGTIDKLGLLKKIDERLPISKEKGAKVTMGQRVSAMILNGLGFMDDRLYMFPEFLENKPIDRLFGDDLQASDFNDDALGRCLDEIHTYGTTNLFSELAFLIGAEQNLLNHRAHFDTSSLSVHGDYSQNNVEKKEEKSSDVIAEVPKTPHITRGYSKDHRPDLKQVVINLATSGAAGFPIWMESHSGNASDKKILHAAAQRMRNFCDTLKEAPSFLYVADSAMYESCVNEGSHLLWLSRVPERINEAKYLLQRADEAFTWKEHGFGYRYCLLENNYKNVPQRWCLVSSDQAYNREVKTLEKRIEKTTVEKEKELWHLSCKSFGCEKDAKKALSDFKKKLKYHKATIDIVEIKKHAGKGRPKKRGTPDISSYKIQGKLSKDESEIEKIRRQKGRFILATNQFDTEQLPDENILPEYKEQSKTESGFKFIKDNTFEVSSIFLKKPSRISALMMVMTLCLMVYSVAQHHLRESLKTANDTIPDQLKKPTNRPTMKRVFKLFRGIQVLMIRVDSNTQELVINLNEISKKIVRYFGQHALRIYSLSG